MDFISFKDIPNTIKIFEEVPDRIPIRRFGIEKKSKGGIDVIDAICGSGKSSWAIQYMNENPNKGFIYVTPYLDEIERIKTKCPFLQFKSPSNQNSEGSKLADLKKLIASRENIATTHELFKRLDDDILELIEDSKYVLILDEVLNVINEYPITKNDMRLLLDTNTCKEDNGHIVWLDESYKGKFEDVKKMSEIGNIFFYRDTFLFWTITPKSFKVFEKVYILTYLFDGQLQKYFYDIYNIEYTKKSVIRKEEKYEIVDYDPKHDNREKLAQLINVHEDVGKSKLNTNYSRRVNENSLSSTNLRNLKKEDLEQLRKNIDTYFRSICKEPVKNCFWTTIVAIANKIKGNKNTYKLTHLEDGSKVIDKAKCNFVPCNARATNIYRERSCMAYVYNRFMNPYEKSFFEDNGAKVDEDLLAISDLIQWMFRSRLREEQPVNIYIPSPRMRNLLYEWLRYEL